MLGFSQKSIRTRQTSVQAKMSVLMGYSATQKGYLLFDIHDKKKFVSRNVEFKEDVFPFD